MAKDGQGFYNLMPKKKKMLNLFGAKEATFMKPFLAFFMLLVLKVSFHISFCHACLDQWSHFVDLL